jgi:hypothetical protein
MRRASVILAFVQQASRVERLFISRAAQSTDLTVKVKSPDGTVTFVCGLDATATV